MNWEELNERAEQWDADAREAWEDFALTEEQWEAYDADLALNVFEMFDRYEDILDGNEWSHEDWLDAIREHYGIE